MEWRKIETAPKDGTSILATYQHEGKNMFSVVSWDDAPEINGWCIDNAEIWDDFRGLPTHWQPLPAPPKDTAWIDAAAVSDFNDES